MDSTDKILKAINELKQAAAKRNREAELRRQSSESKKLVEAVERMGDSIRTGFSEAISQLPAPQVHVEAPKMPEIHVDAPKIPDINIPEINIPEISVPTVNIPESKQPRKLKVVKLARNKNGRLGAGTEIEVIY